MIPLFIGFHLRFVGQTHATKPDMEFERKLNSIISIPLQYYFISNHIFGLTNDILSHKPFFKRLYYVLCGLLKRENKHFNQQLVAFNLLSTACTDKLEFVVSRDDKKTREK